MGKDYFLTNYKLTGVQVKPENAPSRTASAATIQQYYLANLSTESNCNLQYFTGMFGSTGLPVPNKTNVYQTIDAEIGYKHYSAGGCKGCHGNAQTCGADFSFLFGSGPFSYANAHSYPSGLPVQEMDCSGLPEITTVTH